MVSEIEQLAEKANVSLDFVERGSPGDTWRGVVKQASAQGRLRALVEEVLRDSNKRAFHEKIRLLIE